MSRKEQETNETQKTTQELLPIDTKQEVVIEKDANAENLIALAIKEKVNVDVLERLLTMREKIKQEQAREIYFEKLKELQKELPAIKKSNVIKNKDGSIRYKYATLDDIIAQTKSLIADKGFSYQFFISQDDKQVTATCIVNHVAGHSESMSVSVPLLQNNNAMNNVQVIGACITYAKRYAFCGAFGIATEDEDTDTATEPQPTQKQQPQQEQQQQTQNNKEKEWEMLYDKAKVLLYKLTKDMTNEQKEKAYYETLKRLEIPELPLKNLGVEFLKMLIAELEKGA